MDTSIAPAPEQSGIFENPQMFRNRRERHVVRPGEIGNAPVAPRQVRQNLPARGIGQRSESFVQCSRGIFNHLVNYLAASFEVQTFFCRSPISACVSPDYRQSTTCESIRFASALTSARF